MTEEEFISVLEEINGLTEGLKTEVILAELIQNSALIADDVIIKNQSTFNRSYRNDLVEVQNIDNQFMRFAFHLSRNGIYDLLPEGLFHSPNTEEVGSSHNSKRKKLKNTEKEVRNFFGPFENEFFYQKLQIEQNERSLLNNFYNLEEDFLIDFWKIDTQIPKKYLLKLIRLLPNSHQIAGDFELTRLSIEKILGERVVFKKKFQPMLTQNTKKEKKGVILGVDTILEGDENLFFEPVVEVTIGPVKPKKIDSFMRKNGILKFMELFYDFFIPLEYKVLTHIELSEDGPFVLGDPQLSTMGITTTILN